MNAFQVYDDKYIWKTKIRTYGDKVYTNFRGLNMPDDIAFESLTVIPIHSLLAYEN